MGNEIRKGPRLALPAHKRFVWGGDIPGDPTTPDRDNVYPVEIVIKGDHHGGRELQVLGLSTDASGAWFARNEYRNTQLVWAWAMELAFVDWLADAKAVP